MDLTSLAIIIPTISFQQAQETIESCLQQKFPCEKLSIYLIINGLKNEVQHLSPNDPSHLNIALLKEANPCKARNMGKKLANDSDVILFLDDDCVLPHKSYLQSLMNLHNQYSFAGLGGHYLNHPSMSFWGRAYNLTTYIWQTSHQPHNAFLLAGNASYKMQEILNYQFEDTLVSGGEEIDFYYKLKQDNKSCQLFTELNVLHRSRKNIKSFFSRAKGHGIADHRRVSNYPFTHYCKALFFYAKNIVHPLIFLASIQYFLAVHFYVAKKHFQQKIKFIFF